MPLWEDTATQGLNLGALFFLTFTNDTTPILNCNVQMFAEDIKISLPVAFMKDHLALQQCEDNTMEWAQRNFRPLNHKKTVLIT